MPDEPNQPEAPRNPGATPNPDASHAENPELEEGREAAQSVVDRFAQPGGLEVEHMPESNQLKNLRDQTHDSLTTIGEDEAPAPEAAFSGDSGGFMELLKEANLSPRHLKFCCGGVFVVILLIALVIGGIELLNSDGSSKPDKVKEQPTVVVEEEEPDVDISGFTDLDPTLYGNIVTGEDVPEDDPSTGGGGLIGEELTSDDALAQYILDFSDMFSAMEVDVRRLLDQSRDRQQALDDFVHELNFLLYQGRQNLQDLEDENLAIAERFELMEDEKNEWELRFFDDLRELDAYSSVNALDAFTDAAQEIVVLRAQFQAREKLISYYVQVIEEMELRINDIELNEEALVKGIQVVDIPGSDIDVIIEESEL